MTTFGRYEILDKLGEGAMGVVYRAQDAALGRVVALKMLSAELGGEEELHQRFQREAEAIGRLSHPHIVTVYDMGDAEGQLYMAMELLEGQDMRKLVERGRAIPLADRVRILAQICDGMAYAHSRGVVHRDIKPANILVTTKGQVKLLDFGLARVAARSTITRRGVILGTPDYMSPEQAMGRNVDHRSDIFSAGAVFYEFLGMAKPFRGKTLHSVLYQILSEAPEPLLTLNPRLPARLAAVVHGMLCKEPEKRYESMDAVRRALLDIHAGLRRSHSRAATGTSGASVTEEVRARVREYVSSGRAHLEAGRLDLAMGDLNQAMALDPACEEAAESLWRIARGRPYEPPPADAAIEARVTALLAEAAPGADEASSRRALAELALIAPDDSRVVEAARERAIRAR